MGAFDDILAQVTEEGDRAVLTKYPKLKETIGKLETDYQAASDRNKSWDQWVEQNWVWTDDQKTRGATKQQLAAEQRAADLEARLATADLGGDMTFEEVLSGLKAQGYEPAAAITAKVDEKLKTVPTEETVRGEVNKTYAAVESFYGATAHLPVQHFQEFGEHLKMSDLLAHMNKIKVWDPEKAYGDMVAQRRQTKIEADLKTKEEAHLKAIQEAEERGKKLGAEETKRNLAMGQGGRLPTDLQGPGPMGHLQNKLAADRKAADNTKAEEDNIPLGSGLDNLMMQDHLAAQASKTVQ